MDNTILLLKGQIRNDIRSIFYSDQSGYYHVTFNNGKSFKYNIDNVVTLVKDEDLLMPVRVTRKVDGYVFQNIIGVSTFVWSYKKAIGAYRIVFENGSHRDYLANELLVEKHVKGARAKSVYNYLKDLSYFSHIAIDEDKSIGLFQKYERVKMISELSPLANYLVPDTGKDMNSVFTDNLDVQHPIFPFGCNRSQYKAVINALCNKISVIQGPPGTGKTQTILNIVANLIIAGKSIEIVSNNNSAVENVVEKLRKYDLGWLVAHLGNTSNKAAFYNGQIGLYPSLEEWHRDDLATLKKEITNLLASLENGYKNLERLSCLQEELRQAERQKEIVEAKYIDSYRHIKRIKRASQAVDLIDRIKRNIKNQSGKVGFFTGLKLRTMGIKEPICALASLEIEYYRLTVSELRKSIDDIEINVKSIRENEEKLKDYSIKYLRGKIYKLFMPNGRSREVFSQGEVERNNPQPFLKEYPIVLSTTFSATTNISASIPFDYLIMDEASQVDVSAGALALNAARNAVVVGDLKQLPNVVTTDDRIAMDMLIKKYDIPQPYESSHNSFLSSLCRLYEGIPMTMLREHYRCAPAIIGFCNKQFYNGELIAMTREGHNPSIKLATTGEGNFARGSVNQRQAEMIAKEIVPEVLKMYGDIGIIAPYNEQVFAIQAALHGVGIDKIPVATVHKFQGRENDVIILSTVDNQIRSFVDDPHLLNVAVSRAKKLFILVVSGNEQECSNVKDLIDYIKYYNPEVFQSSICSVFDLLYSQMVDKRMKFLSEHKRESKYLSENLMFALLDDIVKETSFQKYGFLNNYPLRYLIPPINSLDENESIFARKSWSHIDFLLYDKVSHLPVLAIEVDGTSFHFKGSDQSKRDEIKNSVLKKIGIPLLRLSTDGSSEKERIREALSKKRAVFT